MKRTWSWPQAVGAALVALAAAQPLPTQAGKLYRWVDEQGQVHYSDKVPAEAAGQKRDVLSKQGVTQETVEAAKTPEQLAEEERQTKLKEEEKRRAEEQAARDRILLQTYTTEDDIIIVRDGKIAALEAYINVADGRIGKLTQQLTALRKQAEQAGANAPNAAKVQQDIANTEKQIRENRDFVSAKRREQDEIRAQYDQDLRRFREIKGSPR